MTNSKASVENTIHPTALVETDKIGKQNRIWAFVHILPNAFIGNDCTLCDHCFIESDVRIGNRVTLKSGVYLWSGITLEDDVFIGPGAAFTNDLLPRSGNKNFSLKSTLVKKGASVGANSTILAGVTIGSFAITGIGSVVTKNVPDHALVFGNPARFRGWIDEKGNKMKSQNNSEWTSMDGIVYVETPEGLKRK